jgi:arylsulfatase A-like enzyme
VQDSSQTAASTRSGGNGLLFACALGAALLLISYARLAGDVHSAAFNLGIVEGALTEPLWRTRLGLNITLFVVALLALHLAFGLACWLLAVLGGKTFPGARCSRRQWILGWYLLGLGWLLVANATRFPHSSLGEPYAAIADTRMLGATPLAIATAVLLAAVLLTLLLALRRAASRRTAWLLAGTTAVAAISGFTWRHAPHAAPRSDQPNVIFLGIDSLRPDAVNTQTAPHVREFLDGAAQFTDAITPLARTFPSWVSVLTGRHPHTTGAYMNLLPANLIHAGTTLPQLLHEHGYRTWYAIDETRFSNIDASYGFDHTINPAMGGSDFVLAWFGDTPLSNLVANTRLGALLFPFLHANRAAHVIYDPDSFVQRVDRNLDVDQPLFLAAHLTLPHWPFSWATSAGGELTDEQAPKIYADAVRRADQQFGDLLALLRRHGALDNALVIVLSDHGEALGRPDDFTPEAFPGQDESTTHSQQWGHGTSVFSPHQYHVVLGIRAYGHAALLINHRGPLHEPVSLLDLAPTVLDLLHIQPRDSSDGQSLAALLQSVPGAGAAFDGRVRFTESEYNPQGFSLDNFDPSALANAARVFRLDPVTDRITVRPELLDWIMSNRQYAALLGDSLAGAVPNGSGADSYRFVFEPGSGPDTPQERLRLRQALEGRFTIRFTSGTQGPPGS